MREKNTPEFSVTYISEEIYDQLTEPVENNISDIVDILNDEETTDFEKAAKLLSILDTFEDEKERTMFLGIIISCYQTAIIQHLQKCNSLADFSIYLMEILDRGGDIPDDYEDEPDCFS